MILILSTEADITTGKVVEWIIHLGGNVIRWNEEDLIEYLEIDILYGSYERKKDVDLRKLSNGN